MDKLLKNTLWICLLIITSVLALKNAQGIIFPIAIITYLLKERIEKVLSKFPLMISFISVGVLMGLLTEFFAILSNLNLPPDKKVLLHPNPAVDLLMGFFYYSFVIITWYLILRKYNLNKKSVFIISGLLGIFTEQMGAIFLGIFTNPLLGVPIALIIACVYGVFPTLAYTLTEKQFSSSRITPKYYHYILAFMLIMLQWAIYGLFVHNLFIQIFPK